LFAWPATAIPGTTHADTLDCLDPRSPKDLGKRELPGVTSSFQPANPGNSRKNPGTSWGTYPRWPQMHGVAIISPSSTAQFWLFYPFSYS